MRGIVLFLLLAVTLPSAWSTSVVEPSAGPNTNPLGICVGPDGNIWYATNTGVASMNINTFAVFLDGQASPTAVRPINCVSGRSRRQCVGRRSRAARRSRAWCPCDQQRDHLPDQRRRWPLRRLRRA